MAYRMRAALVASLGAVALTLAAGDSFARSGVAPAGVAGPHVRGPASFPHSIRHHHRGARFGGFFPAGGGYIYDPSYSQAPLDLTQPASQDIRYTYTYDVPWDWAHRFPPNVVPTDRAYITQCPEQTVTVRGRGGADQTVNIMRCY
jgi:hypothetical protein